MSELKQDKTPNPFKIRTLENPDVDLAKSRERSREKLDKQKQIDHHDDSHSNSNV